MHYTGGHNMSEEKEIQKPQLPENKRRQSRKPSKKKEEPMTNEQLSERVTGIERFLSGNTTRNAEFALSSLREMSQKVNEMGQQINIMGGYLEEKDLIDDCNAWYENKIAEETKKQHEMIENAKAERIKQIEEQAAKMKEADSNDGSHSGTTPPDATKEGPGDGNKDTGGTVQGPITGDEVADGGRIKSKKK